MRRIIVDKKKYEFVLPYSTPSSEGFETRWGSISWAEDDDYKQVTIQIREGALQTGGTKSTVVTNWLNKNFGKFVVKTKTFTVLRSEKTVRVLYYKVYQFYADYTNLKAGKAKFSATYYSRKASKWLILHTPYGALNQRIPSDGALRNQYLLWGNP